MRKTLLASTAMVLAAFGMASAGTVTSASAQEVKGAKITLKLSHWGKRRAGGNFKLCYGEHLSKFETDKEATMTMKN